jgi:hypothetical protein
MAPMATAVMAGMAALVVRALTAQMVSMVPVMEVSAETVPLAEPAVMAAMEAQLAMAVRVVD